MLGQHKFDGVHLVIGDVITVNMLQVCLEGSKFDRHNHVAINVFLYDSLRNLFCQVTKKEAQSTVYGFLFGVGESRERGCKVTRHVINLAASAASKINVDKNKWLQNSLF